MAKRVQDEFTRQWIIENAIEILSRYEPGVLTIRALHYQLVSIGMTNTLQHYKRVVLRNRAVNGTLRLGLVKVIRR